MGASTNGFSLGRPPAAMASRVGLALAGLLAVAVARLGVPRLAPHIGGGGAFYYAVSSLLYLGLAAALYLAGRRAVAYWRGSYHFIVGVVGGFGAWLAAVAAAGFLDLVGRGPGGGLGVLLVALYSFSYALAVASGLMLVGLLSRDPGVSATLAGLAYAAVTVALYLAGDTGLPAVLAVAAANIALAGAVYLVGRGAGVAGAAGFLGVLQLLVLAGPVTIGGGFLVASIIVSLAAVAGWLVVEASLGTFTPSLSGPGVSWRKAAAAMIVVAAVAGGGVYLASKGVMFWRPYVIVTGSMEPTLMRGDMVILEKVEPGEIRVGDIITFIHQGVPVTHRVVEVHADGSLQTKGDANSAPDPYTVRPDQVVGRVYAKIPKLGWLVIALNWNPTVRLAAIIGITALLAALLIPWGGEKTPEQQETVEGDERTTVDRGG